MRRSKLEKRGVILKSVRCKNLITYPEMLSWLQCTATAIKVKIDLTFANNIQF